MAVLSYGKLGLLVTLGCYMVVTLYADQSENKITHDECTTPEPRNCFPKPSRSSKYCTKTYYNKIRKKTGGSWWSSTKYYYVKKKYTKKECCSGHSGSNCYPACHDDSSISSCNRKEGRIKYKDGTTTTCSGGACTAPDSCEACNFGYYPSSDGYCRECNAIANCDLPTCSNGDSSTCLRCSGEVKCDAPGYYVYMKSSSKSKCVLACSWKSGRRCYPGSCNSAMLLTSCTCAEGFINKGDCDTFDPNADALLKPKVLELEAFLDKDDGSPQLVIPDPAYKERRVWTNDVRWLRVSVETQSQFKTVANNPPPYIVESKTKIGLSSITVKSILRRGTSSSTWRRYIKCYYATDCSLDINPTSLKITPWSSLIKGSYTEPFRHADSITFTAYIKNGGKVTYNNWDKQDSSHFHYKRQMYYYIKGIEVSHKIEVAFDLYEPEHCAQLQIQCSFEPLVVADFFETSSIDVTWEGWTDGDSGLKEHMIDLIPLKVYDLSAEDPVLQPEHIIAFETVVNASKNTASVTFKDPGPYYVEMNVYDWAGNFKSTRRICLFDDMSTVNLTGDNPNVTLATADTDKEWINRDFSQLTLVWPNRFINTRHHVNGWLNQVESLSTVSRELDDTKGKSLRTIERYHNIQGVVRVDVGYQIDTGFGNPPQTNEIVTVSRAAFDAQQLVVQEDSNDGDKYTFTLRGYDAIGKYAEDTYSVKVDASPPVITNLWLTKGDLVNISVHDVTEFNKLTIEWDQYDEHSGIYEISWRLFDNYTGDVIVHGNAHETPQGDAPTLEDCKAKFGSYARGAQCYCTPFDGCYHSHYQVKPLVTDTGNDGLHEGRHIGKHESDYFIEVVAINRARLETKLDFKITVDTSPPHEGSVHDGLKGQTEVDFQQSLSLRSNWNGFFDKESAVWFYLYRYGTECIPSEEFDLDWTEDHSFTKTYNMEGHFEATEPGTYYVTVAAYNHALDHSLPVCSDGVTIDSNPAQISEVVVRGAVTKPGFIKTTADKVVYLHWDRTIQAINNPSTECINKATLISDADIKMIPERRNVRGEFTTYVPTTSTCESEEAREQDILSFVTSDSFMDISWNVSSTVSGIHTFEVGLASHIGVNPDRLNFVSSNQHQRIRLLYPNVWNGEQFFILLKTTTKANIENIESVGPFIVCKTTPTFTGSVLVQYEEGTDNEYLIASWSPDSFDCDCDPYQLRFEVGVGTDKSHDNVLPFQALSTGGRCTDISTCAAINIRTLPWNLHGYKEYHVIIKVTNVAGSFILASSDAYIHGVELASKGVVIDVTVDGRNLLDDTEDIDFQTQTTKITAAWTGFEHPYLNIRYIVCLKEKEVETYISCEDAGTNVQYTTTGLTLEAFKTYLQVVIAETNYGNVSAISDGVTVVVDGDILQDVLIRDGPPLFSSDHGADTDGIHHDTSRTMPDVDDLEYQRSTNSLFAHWDIPTDIKHFTSDIYWSVEERAGIAEHWETTLNYEHHKLTTNISAHDLFLHDGRKYRFSIKFCAEMFCFQPLTSNGVMIIPSPPGTGSIDVDFNSATNEVNIEMERFYDTDIPNNEEAVEIMDHYEWTITDNSHHGNIILEWTHATISSSSLDTLWFTVPMQKEVLFTKCWRLSVRGYTKAGLYSTVSSDIKNCSDINQVRPALVLDAVGIPVDSKGAIGIIHNGQPITLAENAHWLDEDKDYTTYDNVISAVWPTLRYKRYKWAVIEASPTDPVLYYKTSDLQLQDPCSHPDAKACGETDDEYMNAMFDDKVTITHGRRYVVCIQANATSNVFEKWIQELPDITVCSNGVTVDLTPPTPNDCWIGNENHQHYQTTTSDISVNWKSFTDVEEEGNEVHQSGITKYEVAIGSAYNGVDVKDFTDVGVTNHVTFHGLRLQQGHTYFATVRATDFTKQQSQVTSPAVRIDTTAPELTGTSITLRNRRITSTSAVFACWAGVFIDDQSGISHFEWGVGSHPGYDNIYTFTTTDQECGENSVDEPLTLIEGHSYFISVKAHNNAGLVRIASSWAITVDASPPVEGHVYDGSKGENGNLNDIDYVSNTSVIEAHWTEFYDHHSPVTEYFVSAGSCQGCDDILQRQPIGIANDLRLDMLHLVEGMRYFVSITACNAANLCSTSSSDGVVVDTSPPMAGRVLDGIEGRDVQYQTSRLQIGAEWYGFVDPQSGISHYVWRVGTEMYGDDILTATNVHTKEDSFIIDYQLLTGNMLPVGTILYSTVRVYNKAGMYTESCSNGFIIDDSAPIIVQPLTQSNIGTTGKGTSVLRSIFKVQWDVQDDQSFIDEQYLSISSHVGGDFNLSSTKIEGIVRDYTFTGLELHDGSYYDVHLTVCNGAKQCVESSATNILIDSSPPTPGMFAIDTDHAANLVRQPDSWMTWTVVGLRLAWIGFEDIHSGIDRYMINIGSSFFNDDLNTKSGESISNTHADDGLVFDEGTVQVMDVMTARLSNNMRIFISMWAINKAGLPSPVLHGEFKLIFGGIMSLVRRCDAHTCYGHCVCAPHGETCESDTMCNDVTTDNGNTLLEVQLVYDLEFPPSSPVVIHTPIDSMMGAKWTMLDKQGMQPQWYEWSVGESQYDVPKGVYNEADERVWYDAGRSSTWIVTFTEDHLLKEHVEYSFFVRAWYDLTTFAIFKSSSVMIYSKPPLPVTIQGKSVKELKHGSTLDIDYFDRNMQVLINWDGKFNDHKGSLDKYHVYISSSPGGHDVHVLGVDLPTSVVEVNITGLEFKNNTHYYGVVQAYNKAGLHTTECSDGFTIDSLPPNEGVVHDGEGLYDLHAINSSEILSAFWFGFTDMESGIKNYETCISTRTNSRCDIKTWNSVGITTKESYSNSEYINDGTTVYHNVRAVDAAGHISPPVRSSGITIDRTAPVRNYTLRYDNNVLSNPSFEINGTPTSLENFQDTTTCDEALDSWTLGSDTCLVSVESPSGIAADETHFVVLSGFISQELGPLPQGKYRLSFYTSHILNSRHTELSSAEGYIDFMDQRHVFVIHNKPSLVKEEIENIQLVSWQEHHYYFHITDDKNVKITIGTAKKSSHFAIDNVLLEIRLAHETSGTQTTDGSGHVSAKPVFANDWASIHAEWNFIDEESAIVEYLWAIGTVKGGTQLQDFKTVGRQTFAYAYDLHLIHNSVVYVTVVAINRAGLRAVSYSAPIIIDKTPPVFSGVFDGNLPGKDLDVQKGNEISVSWFVEDPESDIKQCQWAIGNVEGDTSIQNFIEVPEGMNFASATLSNELLTTLYVTVKCTNHAYLSTTMSTDGIVITKTAPSIDSVFIDILGVSKTQYTARDSYHADPTYIKFRWTGFHESDSINSYLFRWTGFHEDNIINSYLQQMDVCPYGLLVHNCTTNGDCRIDLCQKVGVNGPQISTEELVQSSPSSFSYASFTSLTLQDGNYTVYVTAINQVQMYSQRVTKELVLITHPPALSGTAIQTSWNPSTKIFGMAWSGVFTSIYPMYYEVTAKLAGAEGDLIQWQETTNTELYISLDTTDIVESTGVVHVTVRAICYCGLFTTAKAEQSIYFT